MYLVPRFIAQLPGPIALGILFLGVGLSVPAGALSPARTLAASDLVQTVQESSSAPTQDTQDTQSVQAQSGEESEPEQVGPDYVAPDFEAFFADDLEGGKALDLFWTQRNNRAPNAKRDLPIVRKGLRRTTVPRTSILRWVGNKFIWEKNPQNADAIEIMYNAADYRPASDRYGTRHFAVYFGLSVIRPKPKRILRTMANLAMATDNPDTIGRVAWGCKTQQAELLAELQPYRLSSDRKVLAKVEALQKIFQGELNAFAWAKENAKRLALDKVRERMPEYRAQLMSGSSEVRQAVLAELQADDSVPALELSFLPVLQAAAQDSEPKVRALVAEIAGKRWCDRKMDTPPEALPLLLTLSGDPQPSVRYAAVHFGLANIKQPPPQVLERLLGMLRSNPDTELTQSIHRTLQYNRKPTFKVLERQILSAPGPQALWAYQFYERIANRTPPITPPGVATVAQLKGTWNVELALGTGGTLVRMPLVFRTPKGPKAKAALTGTLGESKLEQLCYGHQNGELVIAFECDLAGTRHYGTARLQGGQLHGTARPAGLSQLLFWTATRKKK